MDGQQVHRVAVRQGPGPGNEEPGLGPPGEVEVLRDVSLSPGDEVLAVVGLNGSGKSTLTADEIASVESVVDAQLRS